MVLGDIICVYAHTFHFSHFTNLYYLQCLDCRWFYTFSEGVVPNTQTGTATLNALPLPSPTLPLPTAPSPQLSTVLPTSRLCFRAPNCKRLANSFCTNRACRSCCIKVNGGCRGVRGHAAANPRPQRTNSVIPPPSQPMLASSSSLFEIDPILSFDSFAELVREGNPVLRLREECASQAAAEHQAASHEARLEAQEDEEFKKAITESLRSLPSSPIASTSSLPDPQPMLPTSTAFSMGGLPVTRVTTSNRPSITTQMSKDWMRPYQDKSKETQESPGKRQVDKEIIEKFRVVWSASS